MNRITKTNRSIVIEALYDANQLAELIEAISSVTCIKMLESLGKLKPYISRNEAEKLYGATLVKLWIQEGMIKVIQDGENTSKFRLERSKLDALAKTNNFLAWERRKTTNQ